MTEVAVIGGGIGGLSTAHELVERDFDVAVFEANERFGGKARSVPIDDPPALHGEHGFRFFPGFYRHVIDTMERIPDGDGTVADNLVQTEETLIAGTDGPIQIADRTNPETVTEWFESLVPAFADDIPLRDVQFVIERLLYLLTSCDRRRREELDNVSWWEFLDAENRSEQLRERLSYVVQSLVALRPQVGSARTVGTIYLQLLFGQLDPTRPAEQILDGPTSKAWIDPWIAYLDAHGVDLYSETPVRTFTTDRSGVTGAVLAEGSTVTADEYVLAVPVEAAPAFVTPELARQAPALARIDRLDTAWMNGVQFYLSEDLEISRGHQVYADSPWALTAISQRQFWEGYDFEVQSRDGVEGVLSVIASDWNTPGIRHDRPARDCRREEIVEEIWAQLKAHLNADGETLTDEMLVEWFLDPALVDTDDGVENRSPLLVNTVGSLTNRPPADIGVSNLTVASDYVRTNSDLASMESANEAGRRAANAILRRHGRDHSLATIWDLEEPTIFEPFKQEDRVRYRLGLPHPAEVTQSLRSLSAMIAGPA